MSRRKARSTLYFVILLQDFRIIKWIWDCWQLSFCPPPSSTTNPTVKTTAVIKLPIIVKQKIFFKIELVHLLRRFQLLKVTLQKQYIQKLYIEKSVSQKNFSSLPPKKFPTLPQKMYASIQVKKWCLNQAVEKKWRKLPILKGLQRMKK